MIDFLIDISPPFGNLGLEIGGEMNLAAGIQVAQLALKHRQNKKQQQRIIVFAGRFIISHHACLFVLLFASSYMLITLTYVLSVLSNMTKSFWR